MLHTSRRLFAVTSLLGLSLITGCGGSDSGTNPGTDPDPTPTIAISLSGATVSVEQGQNGTITVTLVRDGGFVGAVTLSAEGLPSGVTIPSSTIAAGSTQGTLTIEAVLAALVGNSTVTVRATGTGVADATATFALTVTAAPPTQTPAFSMTLTPASLSVQQAASGSATVGLSRSGGFTGAVSLAVSGAPTGVTATVSGSPASGNEATLNVAVGSSVAAGNYTLTLTGSGTGVSDQTASLSLAVTAAPVSGESKTWTFCPTAPSWFAVQNGTGAWTQVVGTGGQFTFQVTADNVGVAWVILNQGNPQTNLRFAHKDELDGIGASLCNGTKTVNGTVPGLSATNTAFMSLGGSSATVVGAAANPNFTFSNVRDGAIDLLATRTNLTINGQSVSTTLDRILLQRGLNPASGSSVNVDFAGGVTPVTPTVTATGLNGASALTTMIYLTSGTTGVLFTETSYSGAASRTFPAVPAAQQQDGDLHGLTLTTQPDGANNVIGAYRSASIYFKDPTNRAVTFGPAIGATTFTTAASAPYLRPRVQYTRQSEYNRLWYVSYQQGDRNVVTQITDDYQGAADIDYTLPDFSSVAGWDNQWGLVAGQQVTFGFVTSGWASAGGLGPAQLAEGVSVQTATRTGMFNP